MRIEEFFAGLLDSTNLIIYLKDVSGRYIYVNRKYELVSSVPRGFIIGKHDADLFSPEVARLFREQDDEVARRKVPLEFEETIQLPTGLRSFITEKFPLIDKDGKVYATGGFCTEITTQSRRSDESLAAERERLVSTLRCIGDAIISTDLAGGVLLMNPAAEALTGKKGAEVLGRPVDEVLRTADPARREVPRRLVEDAAAAGRSSDAPAEL